MATMVPTVAATTPRRFWLSTSVVIALTVFLCVFQYIFLITWDKVPSVQKTLWFRRASVNELAPYHFSGADDGAWLILIACLGFVTPILELITWIPVGPLSLPKAIFTKLKRFIFKTDSHLPTSSSLDVGGLSKDADPAVLKLGEAAAGTGPAAQQSDVKLVTIAADGTTIVRPERKKASIWLRCIPAWVLHLSPAAMTFLFFWVGAQAAAWFVPYAYRYLYLTNPNNTRLRNQLVRGGHVSYTVIAVFALGRTAGWPCCMAWAMVMVPTDRSSSWLAALNMSHEEANIFHRLFGWAFVLWTSIHGAFMHAAYLCESVKAWRALMFYGKYYNSRTDYFLANIGWMMLLFVTATSLAPVRKHFYNLFRISHLLIWPIFPLLIMHEYYIYFWVSYGLLLYAADLAQRWVLNCCLTSAVLTAPEKNVACLTLRLTSRHMRPTPDWAGKVLYIRVGRVSWWEVHPYSIAAVDGQTVTLLSGVVGNWTQKLYNIAVEAGPDGVEVMTTVEGPYGADLTREVSDQDAVVLLAGGLGITPIASLLKQLLEQPLLSSKGVPVNVYVVWVVRQASLATILPYNLLLRAIQTAGFKVRINVTTTPVAEAVEPALNGEARTSSSSSSSTLGKLPNHLSVPMPQGSEEIITQPSPFRAFLRRFICKTLIVWMATFAIVAGYVIACQIVYVTNANLPTNTALDLKLETLYNASTQANNYRDLSGLPRNTKLDPSVGDAIASLQWPEAQPLFSTFRSQVTRQVLFGDTTLCFSCNDNRNPDKFPFGMQPFICCTWRVRVALIFIRTLFPFLLALILSIFTAIACKSALARRWPLFTRSDSHAAYKSSPQPSMRASMALEPLDNGKILAMDVDTYDEGNAKGYRSLVDCFAMHPHTAMWRQGRPQFDVDLSDIAAEVAAAGGRHVAVYSCGPTTVRDAVRSAVYHNRDLSNVQVQLREFSFE